MGIIVQDFLNDVPLLVEVARQKSFAKAAEILGLGASTLSRRIKLLEQRMGVLLFYRDTRNVDLTPNGVELLESCEFILAESQKAYDAVVTNMQRPAGLIRISMFRDLFTPHMKEALLSFAARWPDIQIDLTFAEHAVDLRTDPYDIAFLIGPAIAAPLIARKLLRIEPYLYAAPELFERYPRPVEPKDLYKLPCIVLERFGSRWTMTNGSRQETLDIQPAYRFSSAELCRDFAIAGHGIALVRDVFVAAEEKAGRLVRVLPEWSGGFKHDVYLVTGPGQLPQRVRHFIVHVQALRPVL